MAARLESNFFAKRRKEALRNAIRYLRYRTPVAMRCNDQPEGDSAHEIPIVLVELNC